jgi:signal transduction histidine kinase
VSDLRVVVVGGDTPFASSVCDVIAAQLPQAACDCIDPALLRTRPAADALVVDSRSAPTDGVALAARLRAMGFSGAIALIGSTDHEASADAARYGWVMIDKDQLAHDLVPQLANQLEMAGSPHAARVMRARRLVAAGEIAQKLQHSLNNPLMGLLAEAQLMQLENPSAEQAAALERMVALCRRMVELTRSLDGLADRKSTS